MRRRVSSDLGVSGPSGRGIRVFDDTTRCMVSSVLGLSGPSGRGIRIFDDTTCRRVSSFWVVQGRPDVELGFLMILRVAEYHQFWRFQRHTGVE